MNIITRLVSAGLALIMAMSAVVPAWAINETWDPPPSIPRPAFGITNSVDMYRPEYGLTFNFTDGRGTILYPTNEHGPYTHYVDKTAVGAMDGTNTFGTPAKPRLTWPNPANTPEGSAIQVHAVGLGNAYNFNNGSPGSKLGMGSDFATLSKPVFFYGAGLKSSECVTNFYDFMTNASATLNTNLMYQMAATGMVWISASEMVPYGNNTIIERFASTNGNWNLRTTLKNAGITNVAIRECFGVGNLGSGSGSWLSLGGSEDNTNQYSQNIVSFRNIGSRFGQWNPGTGTQSDDRTMCIMDGVATNLWLLDTICFEMGGDFCRLGANLEDPKFNRRLFVGNFRTFRNAENAIDVKGARDAVIANGIMHDMSNTAGGTSVLVVHQHDADPPAPENIWVVNCKAWDTNRTNSRGFVHTGAAEGTDVFFIGNDLFDFGQYAFYLDRNDGNVHLLNNTISYFGVNGWRTGSTIESVTATNNIFYNRTGTGPHISVAGVSLANDSIFYSGFYQPGGGLTITWGSSTYSSVSAFIAGTSVGDNSIEADPLFSNTAARDFTLTESSPYIDAGADIAAADVIFKATFGNDVTILKDRFGTVRGADGFTDMGAYEYVIEFIENAVLGGNATIGGNASF